MFQDFRSYTYVLIIVLVLWSTPGYSDYGVGSGCPAVAVPVQLSGDDVWASYDNPEDSSSYDYRNLYPYDNNTDAHVTNSEIGTFEDCSLYVGAGTYYDGANHLWVLDDNLTCDFNQFDGGDFRAGEDY